MKASFYGHFVAGEDQEAIKPVISNLEKFGVGAILDYSVEEDLSENETKGHMEKTPDKSLDPADEHAQYKPHIEFADRRKGVYSARTYFYEGEEECDMRVNTFLKCIDAAGIDMIQSHTIVLYLSQLPPAVLFFPLRHWWVGDHELSIHLLIFTDEKRTHMNQAGCINCGV